MHAGGRSPVRKALQQMNLNLANVLSGQTGTGAG